MSFLIHMNGILMVAFNKPWMGQRLGKGMSYGLPLGAGVIVAAWVLTYLYIRWANDRYDGELEALRRMKS